MVASLCDPACKYNKEFKFDTPMERSDRIFKYTEIDNKRLEV